MSNALNVSAAADDIIAKLTKAKELSSHLKEDNEQARAQINEATLGGYAVAATAIRTLLDQGLWTTGKQKKGEVSASSALKDALIAKAKEAKVSPGKAKKLIEKAAALVVPGTKLHVPEVHVAAAQGSAAVLKAFANKGFTKEADVIRYVEPLVTDIVTRIIKAVSKLEGKDRDGFVKELCNHEIIDDILAEAEQTTAEERLAARKAEAEKKAAASKSNAAKKAAEKRAAKPKAQKPPKKAAVPKSGISKKGASSKAKAAASDPFAS